MENKRIARLNVKREKDFLYYVKSDEEGYLCVWMTRLNREGKRKKNEAKNNS